MKDLNLDIDDMYNYIVPSYFSIGVYEIVILQDPYGNLLTLKIQDE